MVFDNVVWHDVYYRDGTIKNKIVTNDDALAYVRNNYSTRFRNCELIIEGRELFAMVPPNRKIAQLNKG